MNVPEYYSTQILTTTINIEPRNIKGDINKLVLFNLKNRYEGVCNKDGYIEKDSIEIINRSIGMIKIIDNVSYVTYHLTYKAIVISPSIGDRISCVISSNNKMGLIGFIKNKETDSIEDSPFIIIIPREYFSDESDIDDININDKVNVEVDNFRTKYLSNQIQVVAKPI